MPEFLGSFGYQLLVRQQFASAIHVEGVTVGTWVIKLQRCEQSRDAVHDRRPRFAHSLDMAEKSTHMTHLGPNAMVSEDSWFHPACQMRILCLFKAIFHTPVMLTLFFYLLIQGDSLCLCPSNNFIVIVAFQLLDQGNIRTKHIGKRT